MSTATLIAFPQTAVAGFAASSEIQAPAISPEELVSNLVEDLEIRARIRREYTEYFTNKRSLIRHWLSILDEHGREETKTKLRRIVSEFILLKTDDETTARAYHANCGKLYNIFIDDLTLHVLQAIEAKRPA